MATQPREQTPRRESSAPAPIGWLRGVIDELRKVVWPTPPELYRYTLVVVFTVLVIALFIGGADLAVSAAAQKWVYVRPTP